MSITLYNTLTRTKEEFVPINPWKVWLYSCWPTVYWDPHVWNMRAYVFVDLLRSILTHVWWYQVDHFMNITDVWHLTDDWDHWEDKMEKWARRENKSVRQVARMYENNFITYSNRLQLLPPTYTRATEYIPEQISMVQKLIDKWYTYEIEEDWIYMDTSKIPNYWKLAQLDFEWMNSEHRVDWAKIDSSKKKNLSDFALWKFSSPQDKRGMERIFSWPNSWHLLVDDWFDQTLFKEESDFLWEVKFIMRSQLTDDEKATQWFPWRHIECSAMATDKLGTHFDIHTWWVDHVPVHHTNEIAQSECSCWTEKRVNRRMHWQFLNINWSKVSKSKWDDLSIPGIIQHKNWYEPFDLRYFYFTWHYRSFLDFSWEAMDAAKKTRKNLRVKLHSLYHHWCSDQHRLCNYKENYTNDLKSKSILDFINLSWNHKSKFWNIITKLVSHLSDDLDSVGYFTTIFEFVKLAEVVNNDEESELKEVVEFIARVDMNILKIWIYQCLPDFCKPQRSDEVCSNVLEFTEVKIELIDLGCKYDLNNNSRKLTKSNEHILRLLDTFETKRDKLLELWYIYNPSSNSREKSIPKEIMQLKDSWVEAKSKKNYDLADQIREKLDDFWWRITSNSNNHDWFQILEK